MGLFANCFLNFWMTASRLFIVETAFCERDKNHKLDNFKTPKNLLIKYKGTKKFFLNGLEDVLEDEKLFRWIKVNPKFFNYYPIIMIFISFWNSSRISTLRIKISNDCLVLWNQLNSNSTLQNRWGNKNEIWCNILDKYI